MAFGEHAMESLKRHDRQEEMRVEGEFRSLLLRHLDRIASALERESEESADNHIVAWLLAAQAEGTKVVMDATWGAPWGGIYNSTAQGAVVMVKHGCVHFQPDDSPHEVIYRIATIRSVCKAVVFDKIGLTD